MVKEYEVGEEGAYYKYKIRKFLNIIKQRIIYY